MDVFAASLLNKEIIIVMLRHVISGSPQTSYYGPHVFVSEWRLEMPCLRDRWLTSPFLYIPFRANQEAI